ncbi:MAG: hypothetical protein ABI818_13380 [Acidobacteriota bacterium]
MRLPQTPGTKWRHTPSSDPARLRELVEAARGLYEDVLDAALPEKTPRARAIILAHRLESGRRPDPPSVVTASTGDRLRGQLAATFLELPAVRQSSLLEYQWRSLAGPAMVPVLRALIAPPASSSLRDLALRRLYELAPVEGRAHILRQISNPPRGATLKTLGVLPDRELPALDGVFAASIENRQGDLEMAAGLLQRYASPAIAARVLPSAHALLPRLACRPQAALLAYFVRADAARGRRCWIARWRRAHAPAATGQRCARSRRCRWRRRWKPRRSRTWTILIRRS